MYKLEAPSKWGRVTGYIEWPDPFDFNEANWESYQAILADLRTKKGDLDNLHFGWDVAARFTLENGACHLMVDAEPVDFRLWLEKEEARRIKVMNWLRLNFEQYFQNDVLDPKG